MHETCPVCGQPTEIEVGFFYGTAYVSYALTIAFSVSTFVAWWVLIGMSLDDNRFFWWMGTNAILMILMQRLVTSSTAAIRTTLEKRQAMLDLLLAVVREVAASGLGGGGIAERIREWEGPWDDV